MDRTRWAASILVVVLVWASFALFTPKDRASAAKEETPNPSPGSAARSDAAAPASAKPGADKPEHATDASTPGGTPDPTSLETIGALTAAHYFLTYLNIGFIADAKAKGDYSTEDARKVLRTVLSVVDSVDRQLEALGKRNVAKEDRKSLEQMRAISALFRQQGKDLQTYWDSRQDEDAARYESQRKNTYSAISKLMGVAP
jgi:hypothetical protein